MDLFAGILPFTAVAEAKSFRRAAEQLGVTPAAVSKAVARLEEELGVVLLHRTTRRVALSPEGAVLLERSREAIDQVRAGRELVAQSAASPRGTVTLSASPILGRLLARRLPRLWERHPHLSVQLSLTDRYSRLVDDGVDIAVRMGPLSDSELVARRLLTTRWVTLASPGYLARRGTPQTPDDLVGHDALRYLAPRGKPVDWTFLTRPETNRPQRGRPPKTRTLAVDGPLLVDQGDMLLEAAAAGGGVVQVMDFMATDLMAEGRVVEVLGPWSAPGPDVFGLCLKSARRTKRIRASLDLLEEALAPAPVAVREL